METKNGKPAGPVTAVGGRIVKASDVAASIEGLFNDPNNKRLLALAVPRHLTVDRLLRVAVSSIRRTPALLDCTPMSLLNCVVQASQLGLEVGGGLGHAYLVPFKREATLILGYKGLMDLSRRSGVVSTIEAIAVCEGDTFRWERGLKPVLKHIPGAGDRTDPGKVTHVYGILRLRDGGVQFDVMTTGEVEAIRERSRAKDDGPWITDWTAMALKTVLRRLLKYAPVSVEVQRAVALDEAADAGIQQVFDVSPIAAAAEALPVTGTDVPPPPEVVAPEAPPFMGMDGPDGEAASIAATLCQMAREKGRVGVVEGFEAAQAMIDSLPKADATLFWRTRLLLIGAPRAATLKGVGLTTFDRESDGYLTRIREGRGGAFASKHGADFPDAKHPAGWLFGAVVAVATQSG